MKRKVKIYRFKETYSIKKHGLFGVEREVLEGLFTEEGKKPIKLARLNSLQKKVLRKMGFAKGHFLIAK